MELRTILLLALGGLALLVVGSAVAATIKRLTRELRGARASQLATLQAAARDAELRADETHELLEELQAASRIIREREQAFRLTFDRSPLGAALVAPTGHFLRVNAALCATTGYAESELLRHNVFMIVHAQDRPAAKAQGAALLAGAERIMLETRATRADGTTIWLQVTAGVVSDEQGQPLHILAQVEDVTARKRSEQHLRTAERHMQLVLRTIPEHFWLKDADGRYLLVSHSMARFHGRQPNELIGRTAEELFAPAQVAQFRASEAAALRAGTAVYADFCLQNRLGEARQLTIVRSPVYDDDGTLVGMVGVGRDITAAKAAEEALRQSRERLELALWGADLGMWDWHIPSDTIESNAQFAALIGLTPATLKLAKSAWYERSHPDDLPATRAAFRDATEGRAEHVEAEFRVRHVDGRWRWHAARGRVVERDADGSAVRLVGVTRDITTQREAQDRLRGQEALLRSVSDNLPDGLIFQIERMPNGTGRFRYLSAGVERLWGVNAECAYSDPEALWSRWHPEDRPAFEQAAREACECMSMFEFEGRVCLPNGTTRWSFMRSTPHMLPDGSMLRNGVELDITARKRAEADLQRRIETLQTLNQIGQALTGWTRIVNGLATAGGLLRRLFHGGAVAVWEYDGTTQSLHPLLLPAYRTRRPASAGLNLLADDLGDWLFERQQATIVRIEPNHPLYAICADSANPPLSVLLLSLRARNSVVGLLCISAPAGQSFTPEDVALSQTVGSLLGSAIENGRLYNLARSDAAEQERRRLARELHDSVSQALFAANRAAEMLPQLWELDPEEGRAALRDLHLFTGAALAEMRTLLVELRPRALIEAPLHETLGFLLPAAASRSASALTQSLVPAPPLPPEVQIALYRIAQEALGNAHRHARAPGIALTLTVTPPYLSAVPWDGTVTLSVTDDGRGFSPAESRTGHFGLATMRERAAAVGACLEIASEPGAGTRVSVTWRGSVGLYEEEVAA